MVNYPNKKTVFKKEKVSNKNRGMKFEQLINESNEYYRVNDIANIHKKPIPIQIVKVDYPNRQSAVIKEAYYKVPSTTDYNGVYKGYYIDFEAKETRNKTSFPLQNIHTHQIEHLHNIETHGGISFVLIYVHVYDTIYLLESKDLWQFHLRSITGRKSISFDELKECAHEVQEGYAPRIDYIKVVDYLALKKG